MPKIARYTIVWSSLQQAYHLHEREGSEVLEIVPDSPAWLGWMSQISSFAFHGRNGSYTVCKERRQRGEGYWYGYARVEGRLIKRYLGRSRSLTISQLEQVAQELWSNRPDTRDEDPVERKNKRVSASLATEPLLTTKLHVPRPRPHLVHRPRLIRRLDQGKELALTLISAPVGFGKSTLLADWLASSSIPVAWLSLDPQDNEPSRFLSYLLAALHTCDPLLTAPRQVRPAPPQASSMETMLTLLINDLLTRRTIKQDQLVLVLDNYQVITDQSIHQALSFFLNHLPPHVHLVLATREDPPLSLAQLRGRDNLLELRAADLRFTQEETFSFLVEVMGLPLSKEESALLYTRTEGWITGLQLAAFSLQGRNDSETFITAFSGSNHYVVDYLLEEVLNRQNDVVQNFLLQTCILGRLSAPLCDAVREQSGSQALLDFLERTNLFLVPLDDERQWYRYDRLFAEALRQLLRQIAPELVPILHLRASRWYEQQGLFAEAISHASVVSVPQAVPLVELLTAREREVLLLLLEGASNREIARQLILSVNTVKKHVLNICGKFNVKSRAQVIAKARTLHLL